MRFLRPIIVTNITGNERPKSSCFAACLAACAIRWRPRPPARRARTLPERKPRTGRKGNGTPENGVNGEDLATAGQRPPASLGWPFLFGVLAWSSASSTAPLSQRSCRTLQVSPPDAQGQWGLLRSPRARDASAGCPSVRCQARRCAREALKTRRDRRLCAQNH
jgi:hypothetical protein